MKLVVAAPATGVILPSPNTSANSSESAIRNGGCAILPTTTQLGRKSGFWKHFHPAAAYRSSLANNNALAWTRPLPDKGKRTVLTTEQINDLHRLSHINNLRRR